MFDIAPDAYSNIILANQIVKLHQTNLCREYRGLTVVAQNLYPVQSFE
jgi:hypothetical protein